MAEPLTLINAFEVPGDEGRVRQGPGAAGPDRPGWPGRYPLGPAER
jgi:hypothetical protein